ncbi:ATP-dependent nuclease [Paracoccus actinidiae]|uniref:ATP-dependent nuclease n=1 Tax=Paracoccus actinidiae TaxID=3064531 RepID=UPI0027D2717F|nr:TOPRIM nucleotidyl transferase/hydrolase domain-containing protein [Paracoccus sp. M09]
MEDNGFVSGLENVGHVLQRAALFSVIEFLASKIENDTEGEGFDRAQSDIVLLVKEPEIYQHSSKQQVIHDAFHQTCKDFSAESGIRFQVVFSTHSEKFIGMNKFHSARILRRATVDGEEQHGCASVSVARASRFFAEALNRDPLSDASFESKMHIFSREICEGFFARKVVLVEGVSDRAVLEAVYRAVGRHPDAEGIAIISVDGKTKMDKPLFVFNSLGIPAFAVFDSEQSKADKKQKINANIIIQKVLGVAQPIDFPDGCFEKFASFSENMETHLKGLSAEAWEREVQIYKEEFGFDSDDICKTPWVAQQICGKLVEGGVELARFQRIIDSVDAL